MRYFEFKYQKKSITLYREIEGFTEIMGPILSNRFQGRDLMDSLLTMEVMLYRQFKEQLCKKRPGKDAPREEQIRHNCSVSALKEFHIRFVSIIKSKFFEGEPERHKVLYQDEPGKYEHSMEPKNTGKLWWRTWMYQKLREKWRKEQDV